MNSSAKRQKITNDNDQDEIELMQGSELLDFIYRSEYESLEKQKSLTKCKDELMRIMDLQVEIRLKARILKKKLYLESCKKKTEINAANLNSSASDTDKFYYMHKNLSLN
jgi:hypothetical protein